MGPEQKFPEYGFSGNRIQVETYWEGNVLCFKLTNNTRDTIVNDFHVQFDTSVKIIGWITRPGWIIDQATTDTAKGKFGVKAGPQGQPILPNGGIGIPLGVKLKFTSPVKKNRMYNFNWQATRDGIVVKSGSVRIPR
jgi:hypothetical protein